MVTLREDMLTVIQMKHDWITRKEIVQMLDIPGWEFRLAPRKCAATLERQGWIESRKVGRMWEYRAK